MLTLGPCFYSDSHFCLCWYVCSPLCLAQFLTVQDQFVVGVELLDNKLQKQVDEILNTAEDTQLDFAKTHHWGALTAL